jgi:hypothetical protein
MILAKVNSKWLPHSMGIINIMEQGKIKYIGPDKWVIIIEALKIAIIIHWISQSLP